jgi:hypothetical protein
MGLECLRTMKSSSTCHKCKRPAEARLVDKELCRGCFTRLVEQKIRRNLRQYDIKKDSKLHVADDASRYIIEKVVNRPVRIVDDLKKADRIAVAWTLDDENEEFLNNMFLNKKLFGKEDKKVIKLFTPLSRKELADYLRIKKIKYSPKKTELGAMLDRMESKYPGLKTSLLKSQCKLKELM